MKRPAITKRQPLLLTNQVFIISLILLIVNDFLLKPIYPNWLTGKLSDFAGLIVLALLLAWLFPRLRGKATLISAAVFILWKSPLATPVITWSNAVLNLPLHRVIDYTDLIALLVLPFTWVYIERIVGNPDKPAWPAWSRNLLLFTGSFACLATSMSPKQRADYDGTIEVYKTYSLNVNKTTALNRLKMLGYAVERDTSNRLADSTSYMISHVVLDQEDILRSIRFRLEDRGTKSKLTLKTFQATHPLDMKTFHAARKRYEELVKAGIVAKVQN
jgi:hypothetical protein